MSRDQVPSLSSLPLLFSVPHAGEKIPDIAKFLESLPEPILMGDVDRYVDQLYAPVLKALGHAPILTEWHRYAVDLNRVPTDTDVDSLESSPNASGRFSRGFHWSRTTHRDALMARPYTQKEHQALTQLIYEPFHRELQQKAQKILQEQQILLHLDLHSMPSVGTVEHRDPGEMRADIVISDSHGKSAHPLFRNLVIVSYVIAGFKVAYNWPYYGGRITEQYGHPHKGHHTLQVELNRSLYMDEATKAKLDSFAQMQNKLQTAVMNIARNLSKTIACIRAEANHEADKEALGETHG